MSCDEQNPDDGANEQKRSFNYIQDSPQRRTRLISEKEDQLQSLCGLKESLPSITIPEYLDEATVSIEREGSAADTLFLFETNVTFIFFCI